MTSRGRIVLTTMGGVLTVLLAGTGVAALLRGPTDRPQGPEPTHAPAVLPEETLRPDPLLTETPPPTLPPRPDTDQDGLPDDLERIYGTDPSAADTDRDGFADGLEVANGFDPVKQAPGDKLTPPTPPAGARSYTDRFTAQTGLAPTAENLRGPELRSYIADVNARGFLPEVRDDELQRVPGAGKTVVGRYLDAISVKHNPKLQPVAAEALRDAFERVRTIGDAGPLQALIDTLGANRGVLLEAPVPDETLALHRRFVAATTSVRDNAALLLRHAEDPVGTLVGASRLENLRPVFRAIEEEIRRLETKYQLE